ncbi:MAG: hypothetical protein ABII27_03555 [bacterium]
MFFYHASVTFNVRQFVIECPIQNDILLRNLDLEVMTDTIRKFIDLDLTTLKTRVVGELPEAYTERVNNYFEFARETQRFFAANVKTFFQFFLNHNIILATSWTNTDQPKEEFTFSHKEIYNAINNAISPPATHNKTIPVAAAHAISESH